MWYNPGSAPAKSCRVHEQLFLSTTSHVTDSVIPNFHKRLNPEEHTLSSWVTVQFWEGYSRFDSPRGAERG